MSRLLLLLLLVVVADDIEAVRIVVGLTRSKTPATAPSFRYLSPTPFHRDLPYLPFSLRIPICSGRSFGGIAHAVSHRIPERMGSR